VNFPNGTISPLRRPLEGPALKIKEHGREIYDAVAEFDSAVERVLGMIEEGGEPTSTDVGLLDSLAGLAESADIGLADPEAFYEAVSEMADLSTSFRDPVRNMRAGLHDLLDARTIIFGWGKRVKALCAGRQMRGCATFVRELASGSAGPYVPCTSRSAGADCPMRMNWRSR
jgi:hypothetical protein